MQRDILACRAYVHTVWAMAEPVLPRLFLVAGDPRPYRARYGGLCSATVTFVTVNELDPAT